MKKRTLKLIVNQSFDPSTIILDDNINIPGIWDMTVGHSMMMYDGLIDKIYKDNDAWLVDIINLSEAGVKALDKQKDPVVLLMKAVDTGAFCEFNIIPKYFLRNIEIDIIKPKPTKCLYKITCDDTFDMDFIIVKAADEDDAWDIFWDKIINDPNIDKADFGKKEDYDFNGGYYHMRHGYKSISIDKVDLQNGYNYIGGGNIR